MWGVSCFLRRAPRLRRSGSRERSPSFAKATQGLDPEGFHPWREAVTTTGSTCPDNRERAKERRDWVLTRMANDGLITVSAARITLGRNC